MSVCGVGCGSRCTRDHDETYMAFVGPSRGEYVEELTYKYVGNGKGDFELEQDQSRRASSGGPKKRFVVGGVMSAMVLVGLCRLAFPRIGGDASTPSSKSISAGKQLRVRPDIGQPKVIGGPVPPEFACNEAEIASWNVDEKRYCCRALGQGCPTTPPPPAFDCQIGAFSWADWLPAKKAFCCQGAHNPCSSPVAAVTAGASGDDSLLRRQPAVHVAQHRASPRPQAPEQIFVRYDCSSDDEVAWSQLWSSEQQTFCCQHHGKACPQAEAAAPMEPTEGVPPPPPVPPPAVPPPGFAQASQAAAQNYDCARTPGPEWITDWSMDKKRWCCRHYGTGCVG